MLAWSPFEGGEIQRYRFHSGERVVVQEEICPCLKQKEVRFLPVIDLPLSQSRGVCVCVYCQWQCVCVCRERAQCLRLPVGGTLHLADAH